MNSTIVQKRYNSDSTEENVPVRTEQEIGNCRGLEMECYMSRKMRLKEQKVKRGRAKIERRWRRRRKKKRKYKYMYISAVYMVNLRSCRKERQRERKAVNERIGSGKEEQLAY